MRLVCPTCGAMHSLEALCSDSHARAVALAMASIPAPIGPRVIAYLGLFRRPGASPPRALSWERAARLLGELAPMIAEATVVRHGRPWAAPCDYWAAALDAVLEARDAGTLSLPLKSHGYLFEIVCGISAKAEGRREQATITQARGETPLPGHQTPPSSTTPTLPSSPTPRSRPPEEFKAMVEGLRRPGAGPAPDTGLVRGRGGPGECSE